MSASIDELLYLEESLFLERARKSILDFTLYTKPDYILNWHHKAICDALNLWVEGKVKRLMIFVPPQYGKSELASRRLSAYIMGRFPRQHLILGTYSADLSTRLNRDIQRIIDSDEYKKVFPEIRLGGSNVRSLSGGPLRNSEMFEIVEHMGSFKSVGRGQGAAGMPAHRLIIDDIIKDAKEADSPTIRDAAWDWINTVAMSRLQKNGSVLYIGTRWHEDEPAGRFLDLMKKHKNSDQWEVVSFPAICEDESPDYKVMFQDPRFPGEALWPHKESARELEIVKTRTGTIKFSALYQQRPSDLAGNMISRTWFKFYDVLPSRFDSVIITADLAFEGTEKSDPCAFHCWGKLGANTYLLDVREGKFEFKDSLSEFEAFCRANPLASLKLVEKKANGAALLSMVKSKVPGVVGFNPDPHGSKAQRFKSTTPFIEAGNVFFPSNLRAKWSDDVINQMCRFPKAKNDEHVDCYTMTHIFWFLENQLADWHVDKTQDIGDTGSLTGITLEGDLTPW